MDDLRLHAVVARVVAWHNRNPLARRITAAQVNSVGYVALPYTAPGLLPTPPPPPLPLPTAPVASEPVPPVQAPDIDPAIEPEDSGAIVIDVDPEPQAGTADEANSPSTAGPLPAQPPVSAARPASPLRARALASGDAAESSAAVLPAPVPAAMPAWGASCTFVCSEDFMAPLPVKQVLAWARQHGLALARGPGDGPVREVPADPALLPAGAGVAQLWVATAAIEIGAQRHRLLLGGGDEPAVLGRRAWSPPRLLGALVTPCVLLAALVGLMWPAAKDATGAHDAPAATVPTVAAAVVAPVASAAVGLEPAASAPDASASAAAVAGEEHTRSAGPARLPGLLDDAAKAQARDTVAALRAARQASAATATATAMAANTASTTPAVVSHTAAPIAPPAVLYGLSTRLLRTRAEAEQLQSAFQALLGGAPGSTVRVEMLPAGEDWRVVCWPFERRADAERSRAMLLARGLRVELVDF